MGIIKRLNKNSGYTPKGKLSWTSKLVSEYIGTIFLAWMIGILGVTFGGIKFEVILSGGFTRGASRLVIGWWVGLDVLICLAVFSRWSCDLNPAVTTYRILSGQNSLKYGLTKIGIQFLGGLTAGLCIWSTQVISGAISGSAADQVISTTRDARAAFVVMPDHVKDMNKLFNSPWGKSLGMTHQQITDELVANVNGLWDQAADLKFLPNFSITKEFRELQPWSAFTMGMEVHNIKNSGWDVSIGFIGEFLGVFILLWPIFSKELKSPLVRDVLVVSIVGFGVAALLETGTVAWNPARLLATNWIYDLLKPGTHSMTIYPMYLLGEIAAPFMLFFSQKLMKKANIVWENWLKIGVVKDLSQHLDEGKMDRIDAKHKKEKQNKNKKA